MSLTHVAHYLRATASRKAELPGASAHRCNTQDILHWLLAAMSSSRSTIAWVLASPAIVIGAASVLVVGGMVAKQVTTIAYYRWKYRNIPGPTPHPFWGNAKQMAAASKRPNAELFRMWSEEYGPIFKIFLLTRTFVVVADPDLARMVLMKYTNRTPFMSLTAKLLKGPGLMLDENSLTNARDGFWRKLRNSWQPAFAPGTLERYVGLMESCAVQLCNFISPAALSPDASTTTAEVTPPADAYIDILDLLNRMTLEVVGTCAYGVKFHALQPDKDPQAVQGQELVQACKDFFASSIVMQGSKWGIAWFLAPYLKPVLSWLAHTFPDEPFKKQVNCRRVIVNTSNQLIHDWRIKASSQPEGALDDGDLFDLKRPAGRMSGILPGSFMGLMLSAQQKAARTPGAEQLDDATIMSQANTFILAGTETTANTLSFALFLLCENPDKEARLLEEVDAHGRDTPISMDDKFPYVDAVVTETLRLYPAAQATTRDIENQPQGTTLAGVHLPNNTALLVPFNTLQRNPKYWPRALEFLPERWLPEGVQELGPNNPNCYWPFGGGTRQCPGYKFAQQEARIALVSLYKKYTFKLQPGQVPLKIKTGLTISPDGGLKVQPIPRA